MHTRTVLPRFLRFLLYFLLWSYVKLYISKLNSRRNASVLKTCIFFIVILLHLLTFPTTFCLRECVASILAYVRILKSLLLQLCCLMSSLNVPCIEIFLKEYLLFVLCVVVKTCYRKLIFIDCWVNYRPYRIFASSSCHN